MKSATIQNAIREFRGTLIAYWILLLFSVTHLSFTISVIDDESFLHNLLLFTVSVFFPTLLGQFLALFRLRDLFGCCLSFVICFVLAYSIAELPNIKDYIGFLIIFGPFATLSGLWSIRAGRDVLALFMPTVCLIGSIVYTVNNSSEEFQTWKMGDKWAIWDLSSLSGFVIGIILVIFFLFARERHRILQWSQEFHYKKTVKETTRVNLGQSSLSKILIILFSTFLAFCVAITAPFLWQTTDSETNSLDCSQFEEPPPECQKEQPQPKPEESPPEEGCNKKQEQKQEQKHPQEQTEDEPKELPPNLIPTLLMLFLSFVLLILLFLLSYRPIRRYLKVRHYKKPLYKISSTESIKNYWELIEIALRDMGIQDISAPSAEQVITRHEKEIRDFLKTDRFHIRLKKAAVIHDRVRYGLQINPKDLEDMQNLASDFYDATWRRLQDMQRIESFYSS